MSGNRILIVAAHPDDEILGCAGTVARMVKEGDIAGILFIGTGRKRNFDEQSSFFENAYKAHNIIGIMETNWVDVMTHDNNFDAIPLMEIVQSVEYHINSYKPNIIFTHYEHDLNIDHRITYQAVVTATRPMPGQTVKEIYSFEIPSSTEWAFPTSFSPDVFYDITDTFDLKLEALKQYKGELRDYPHPRSLIGIEVLADYRGMQAGLQKAEAFKTVRVVR